MNENLIDSEAPSQEKEHRRLVHVMQEKVAQNYVQNSFSPVSSIVP